MIQLKGRKDIKKEQANSSALHQQSKTASFQPQLPAKEQHGNPCQGHTEQAQLNGQHIAFSSVFKEKGNPKKQHQQTHPQHHIALGEKFLYIGDSLSTGSGLGVLGVLGEDETGTKVTSLADRAD